MYHFLSGYTSKLLVPNAVLHAPEATFSTCFGSPFLPLQLTAMLKCSVKKLMSTMQKSILVNTGWTGGEYGVGSRMNLNYTRAMVQVLHFMVN